MEQSRVTWYSKLIALVLFVAVVCGAFYFGAWYQEHVTATTAAVPAHESAPTDASSSVSNVSNAGSLSSSDLISAYTKSSFRVVAIIPNPYPVQASDQTYYDALYVVAGRGDNDNSCGSTYGPDTCYFFLESSYAGTPPITYVGSWQGDLLNFLSGKFKDKNTISFTAGGGDAGTVAQEQWELNLRTGSTTLISQKSSNTE